MARALCLKSIIAGSLLSRHLAYLTELSFSFLPFDHALKLMGNISGAHAGENDLEQPLNIFHLKILCIQVVVCSYKTVFNLRSDDFV